MDAKEIMRNGILLKETRVNQRCADCDDFLVRAVYRYKGKKNRRLVVCKNCETASWINKQDSVKIPEIKSVKDRLAEKRKDEKKNGYLP